ncbi:MAG: hypothetical protein PUE75_07955 [Eubacteriales bacterium]|nr:hypothetical protein [Eubacteriales bacterium]
MKMFRFLNKIHSALLVPFVISSLMITLSEMLKLTHSILSKDFSSLFINLSDLLNKAIPFVFCYFITLVLSKGKREFKAFWSVLCLFVTFVCAKVFGGMSLSFLVSVFLSFMFLYCFDRLEAWLALLMTAVLSVLSGILFGYLSDLFDNAVMAVSGFISDKGALSAVLFSACDSLLSLFDIRNLSEGFFSKSFGGSLLFNGEIVTGVKDLFAGGYSGKLVSTYLSGHYFMLFAVAGIAGALFLELKSTQKITLIIASVCAVLSGNLFIFLLFIFFESPFMFLSAVAVNILSYLCAYVLNLDMGYVYNGSIFEMIMNMKNGVYLISGGIVFVCIGFFVTRYVVEKHGISDCINVYIPARLQKITKNLGGIANIIRFKDNKLEVRNPKLINTLELDCEIEENEVSSNNELFNELKDYI